jgi:dienelactone hydrolase
VKPGPAAPALVLPRAVRYDDEGVVEGHGLPPASAGELVALAADDSGVVRRSALAVQADARGGFVQPLAQLLHALAPREPAAFLASLPEGRGRAVKFQHASFAPLALHVRLRLGASPPRTIASATQLRHLAAPGRAPEAVRAGDDVRGLFFPPAGRPVRGAPAALLLAGSGGGLDAHAAALLAQHGVAVFAQGLFAHDDLPPFMLELPVERVVRGLEWLAARVGHPRLVLRGISKGSELAIHAAVHAPALVAGLVPWVPSPMATTGRGEHPGPRALMTLGGRPVPHAVPAAADLAVDASASGPEAPFALAPSFERLWRDPANARFEHPIEQVRCPVLVVSAEDDRIWPSALAGRMLHARHARLGGAAPLEHLCLPDAGHGINLPMTSEALAHLTWHPKQRLWLAVGGTPQGNGAAANAAWKRFVAFVRACSAG